MLSLYFLTTYKENYVMLIQSEQLNHSETCEPVCVGCGAEHHKGC